MKGYMKRGHEHAYDIGQTVIVRGVPVRIYGLEISRNSVVTYYGWLDDDRRVTFREDEVTEIVLRS